APGPRVTEQSLLRMLCCSGSEGFSLVHRLSCHRTARAHTPVPTRCVCANSDVMPSLAAPAFEVPGAPARRGSEVHVMLRGKRCCATVRHHRFPTTQRSAARHRPPTRLPTVTVIPILSHERHNSTD